MTIIFGATAAPLWQQLKWPRPRAENIQACADAITRLAIHGLLSDRETSKARKRLVTLIERTRKQSI